MALDQEKILAGMFWLWVALCVPWLFFFPLSAMAFDAGYTLEAYVFFWSVASYPALVIIAAFARKKIPSLTLLPLLTLAGVAASDLFHTLGQ